MGEMSEGAGEISGSEDMLAQSGHELAAEKSKRIIMFCDLRDSTEILMNFEQGRYRLEGESEQEVTYDQFIFDVHKTSYEYLYLGHKKTHTEIYGDGLMAIFPEDNTKYIMENIYRLTDRMRAYNETTCAGKCRPSIDIGFGITTGDIALVYYYLDSRKHPIGMGVHEAARIEGKSKYYDARILVSEHFFKEAETYINEDERFSYRFIDRVFLKNFHEPITLYELLVDNDPRFGKKIDSIPYYSEAYAAYCQRDWSLAKEGFQKVYDKFGLGIGKVMAARCDTLSQSPYNRDWDGVWNLKDK
ncbi:adenylate/guanylate cyclase domain-containing protein [Mariprofundus sp. EBB-1]|uniref:adenylate/guanylate cyclase domain-containing protein n=1 Tax=Mariprofundus sp. EBB-1 TaxID=2650971 RepID=UPI001F239806|nr:adenylate/guanylate cyclase domain-containing protein [Mariprofundus sp. EBB-1]